jgi:Zn-dependent protease
MFGQAGPTEFDLQFRCFGVPVRVTPWFWLGGVVLGWPAINAGRYDLLIVWLVCLFVSILVHEMGHALLAKAYGWPPTVMLYHFGGVAMFQPHYGYTPLRSILVSFAGPGAGFLLCGLVVAVHVGLMLANVKLDELAEDALWQLEWINLVWGLVNLLPVLPLDGGRISQEVFQWMSPRSGYTWALRLGIVMAGAAALCFFMLRMNFAGIMFAIMCVENIQLHQQGRGGWN